MNNYGRNTAGGNRYGVPMDLEATTETATLTNDRSFTFVIDTLDKDETQRALDAASALARQVREVVVPEVDSYIYTQMATKAGTKIVNVTLTAENIYDEIIKGSQVLDDNEIPETDRSIVVVPSVYRLMKLNEEINLVTNISEELRKKGVIALLDGAEVIKVPANRMPTGIGFMLAHKSATVAPVKLEDYQTHHNPPGISGDLVEGRIVYDAFVLDNKVKGIYTCNEAANK